MVIEVLDGKITGDRDCAGLVTVDFLAEHGREVVAVLNRKRHFALIFMKEGQVY